jgi:hypothetical protein
MMTYKLKFVKENFENPLERQWYLDIPDYNGSKNDLQMVLGADILLDIISGGGNTMELNCTTEIDFEENKKHIVLNKVEECKEGGAYYLVSQYFFHIWLCDITKRVFRGEFPEKIFCKF